MRTITSFAAIFICAFGGTAAFADDFPTKPLEVIIPTQAGGGTDATLRLLAELAEPSLGQRVTIVNRPGGSGTIGVTRLTQAAPDGYTLAGVWFTPLTVAPHTLDIEYDMSDYTGVSMAGVVPLVFCVKPDFPADTGQEFLDELTKNPDHYTYGTDGIAGASHLAAERIFALTEASARAIPLTDSGAILANFLGGHIDIFAGVIGPIEPYVQSGEAKCLLLTTADDNPALPDADGLAKVGLAEAETTVWRGIIAPAGIPEDRLAKIEEAFVQAARTERFQEFMANQGGIAIGSSSAELNAVIEQDYAAFGEIVRSLDLGE